MPRRFSTPIRSLQQESSHDSENLPLPHREADSADGLNFTAAGKNPEEIVAFVNTVSKYDFDMDMRKGRAVVDAKSLLGIMHLGLNNVIELQMYSDQCEELQKELEKYAA